jgi:ferredoxin
MSEGNGVYRKLQQHLERMPIGMPPTKSGVEIRILKQFFSPEDAEIAMTLGALPQKLTKIYRRAKKLGLSISDLEEKLDSMIRRGLIIGGPATLDEKGNKYYSNVQVAIGIFEFQVSRITGNLWKDVNEYMNEEFYKEFHNPNAPNQIRTVPVEASIVPEHYIGNYDNVMQIVEKYEGPFAVMDCICKKGNDLIGKSCQLTDLRENCMMYNDTAEYIVDTLGEARYISKEESLDLLRKSQEAGLILQPENTLNPGFICTCCGDCCGILTSVKKLPRPADYFSSNFYAEVDPELCIGCENCVNRCQMDALLINDGHSYVNLDNCIGCGNCVVVCENDAIHLMKKEKELVPLKDRGALYQKIMMKRRGVWGTMKMVGRMMLGMRV